MPPYLDSLSWLEYFWPLALFAVIVTLVIWTGYWIATRKSGKPISLLIIFSFCSLGMTVGVMTGDSGEQTISTVLPAVLSLVGGLAVFLIGRESRDSLMIAACIAALSITLLLGALIGGANRNYAALQFPEAIKVKNTALEAQETIDLDSLKTELLNRKKNDG